jgi:hypothetical protein
MDPSPDAPAVDPVTSPDAYRSLLLGLLGDDEPAAAQSSTAARMRHILEVSGDRLRERPAPTEWSILECLGHMVDSEIVTSARVRWIIAEDRPDIVGYDQDQWVDGLRHGDDDPEELLAIFETLRSANLGLWARSSPATRARWGVHRERGEESYDLLFRLLAGHDRFHLAQAERAQAALR